MTSESPDDVLHFRGKTLTPESPRPLHIPEPSNIPVLRNQMDPALNETSIYEFASKGVIEACANMPLVEQLSSHTYTFLPQSQDSLAVASNENLATNSLHGSGDDGRHTRNQSDFSLAQSLIPSGQFTPAVTSPSVQNSVTNTSLPLSDANGHSNSPNAVSSKDEQQALNHEEVRYQNSDGEINYQSLLDNISNASSNTVSTSAPTISVPASDPNTALLNPETSLPSPSGLPPRPPPQAKPAIHPNYSPNDDIRSFHSLHNSTPNGTSQYMQSNLSQPSGSGAAQSGAPGTSPVTNVVAPFQPTHTNNMSVGSGPTEIGSGVLPKETQDNSLKSEIADIAEAPWGPEVQKKYDEFLQDERVYVTEGMWDRFPMGSRLFVGNLPTEKVTKRDLFHLFHKYGKLAQISIKQAYGFVQFKGSSSCRDALNAEQGGIIRGRKIHLEISKPQRNTRNAPPPEAPRPVGPRRSRSPEFRRSREPNGGRFTGDRHNRYGRGREDRKASFDSREREDDYRNRDHYRPPGSPILRGRREEYRSRDRSIEKGDQRSRRRSRSPYGRGKRYRSPSPAAYIYTSESELPIPRRAPRDVPDVQIIVFENVDSAFVYRVESVFRDRGLRPDVLMLSSRINPSAVTKRQILEGVLAIVRLRRSNEYTGRIPLQVFDRGGGVGVGNVPFNEYSDLEVKVAAEIVLRAQKIPAGIPNQQPPPPILSTSIPQQPIQNALVAPNNLANLISTLDGPALHSLLGALQQNQQPSAQQLNPQTNINSTDLASLLSIVPRQNNPVPSVHNAGQNPIPQQQYGYPPNPAANANLASLFAASSGVELQKQQPQAHQQVQNIMEHLAKWKQ